MRSNSLAKDMIVVMGGGHRKRRKPSLDGIEKDIGMSQQELMVATRNRTKCREMVMMVTRGRLAT